jgi:antirestriction protein ArdC
VKHNNSTKTTAKADVYEIITERVIALLEKGTAPWSRPWGASAGAAAPANFVSRRPYSGINALLLGCSGFGCPFWVTFNQAKSLGGSVRKGEKGTPVVFWKFLQKTDENGNPVFDAKGQPVKVGFLRYFTVFNLEQTDGIEWSAPAKIENTFNADEACEGIVRDMPQAPVIRYGGDRAYYAPSLDFVQLPERATFKSPAAFYSTAFHELIHATGHESRLNRKGVSTKIDAQHRFGSADYSREELVAEMGAAFLCGVGGILNESIDNSAAYLKAWIEALKGDSKLVVIAAAQAQKAVEFVLGSKEEEEPAE